MLQKKLTRRVLIGEEGRLFIEECTNSLVQGIYTSWMVMIKLKRWSLCVHGCVDGFSRKILWLVSSSTNNDPIVIGNCFLQCFCRKQRLYLLFHEWARVDKIYFMKTSNSSLLGQMTVTSMRHQREISRYNHFGLD